MEFGGDWSEGLRVVGCIGGGVMRVVSMTQPRVDDWRGGEVDGWRDGSGGGGGYHRG